MDEYTFLIVFFVLFSFIVFCVVTVLKSPFKFPYYVVEFDVTGKRNPFVEDYIDNFIIDGRFPEIEKHKEYIEQWQKKSLDKVQKSVFFLRK